LDAAGTIDDGKPGVSKCAAETFCGNAGYATVIRAPPPLDMVHPGNDGLVLGVTASRYDAADAAHLSAPPVRQDMGPLFDKNCCCDKPQGKDDQCRQQAEDSNESQKHCGGRMPEEQR